MPFSIFQKHLLREEINKLWKATKSKVCGSTILLYEEFSALFLTALEEPFFNDAKSNQEMAAACHEIYHKIKKTLSDKKKSKRNHRLLLTLVKTMARKQIDHRDLVRNILTTIFSINSYIDREIFLFDFSIFQHLGVLQFMGKETLRKMQEYILSQVSGWRLPRRSPFGGCTSKYYLDLPFRRIDRTANSHLMAEAIYRQHDAQLVLLLLRYGIYPSCSFIWPICLVYDARKHEKEKGRAAVENSLEYTIIRYFCRARHYIYVHEIPDIRVMQSDCMISAVPDHVSYDDVLLVSSNSMSIIPVERYKIPSSLRHQCRLAIRKSLLQADNLPRGIAKLSLPKSVENFVDLMVD